MPNNDAIKPGEQSTKMYLGDAVYIESKGGRFVLTTEDGVSVTNQIFLEKYLIEYLIKYLEKHNT